MTKQEAIAALDDRTGFFRHWIGSRQCAVLRECLRGEEAEYFANMLTELKARIETMPKTCETDDVAMADKIVHLHYFKGRVDAWVVEKDMGDESGDLLQLQAFGKMTLFGETCQEAEAGYISIAELIENNVEIDLHWAPKPIKECKIGVKQITITRAEGPAKQCGKPQMAHDYYAANAILRGWASTAPEKGGYDKCDFKIEFQDGETYEGRYDLKHWRCESPDLRTHVQGFVNFYCGDSCPSHMTQERYAAFIAREPVKQTQAFREFRNNYDLGG